VRCLAGVFGAALLVGGATFAGPVAEAAVVPLIWAAPVQVDHQTTFNGNSITDVSCLGTGLCAAGDGAGDVLTSSNPTAATPVWTLAHVDGTNEITGMSCPSSGLCVAVDDYGDVITSSNPTGGPSAWTLTGVAYSFNAVSCPNSSLCVAVDAYGDVVTSTNPTGGASAWTVTNVDGSNQLNAVSCPTTGLCVAVDQEGDVLASSNPTGGATAWKLKNIDGTQSLFSVSCLSGGLCVVGDNDGNVLTTTNPVAVTPAWTAADVDGTAFMHGVSCASSSLCVAADSYGDVVTSTNPTAGASAWTATELEFNEALFTVSCPSGSLCVAADYSGTVVSASNPTGAASAWTLTSVDGTDDLTGLSCPSSSLCVAGDLSGNLVTSANPAAGPAAWTVSHVDGGDGVTGVSCPGTGLCVAVDDAGNVVTSTNPTGGVSAWTVAKVDSFELTGVSCPGTGLCVAVNDDGRVFTSTNPTGGSSTWTAADVDGPNWITGVSCPRTNLCVAVDFYGDVLTSTNPTGGVSAWTVTTTSDPTSMPGISCPSASLCVAVDDDGDVFTSTNPTGGASAWTTTNVDGSNRLESVSCASSSLCVAVDQYGDVLTSTNPTGGASAWTSANLFSNRDQLSGVSCPSSSLCVVVDQTGGNVIIGSPPISLQDAPSAQQYFLHGSDGSTWQPMDASRLADTFDPSLTGTALLSANADLWTENAGFNQDIGICLVPGSSVPSTCPTGDLLAWKESGGFAGTFSPNAAYVQATAAVTAGTTETAFVVWKTNKLMPAGDTIAAGAGGGPSFSPARLTVTLPDTSNVVSSASSTLQYVLHGSDGSTWSYVDASALKLSLTPASSVDTVLSANADLWTSNAGFNQDIGICVVAGASLPVGSCPSADVVIWKESGGFAGTYSPNAAFAQTVVAMSAGTYSVALVWKVNKTMPSADTIVIGAGSGPYSPTRLVALQYPASGGGVAFASSAEQYIMSGGSDGATWRTIDATHLTLTVPQATECQIAVGGNADLWTEAAGFNQDIGIQVTPAGGTPYVAAWKESGGFAGTFSPNAAFVEAVIPISDASNYSITLVWKTNIAMPASDYIAVAAGGAGAYSPTTLTATLHC